MSYTFMKKFNIASTPSGGVYAVNSTSLSSKYMAISPVVTTTASYGIDTQGTFCLAVYNFKFATNAATGNINVYVPFSSANFSDSRQVNLVGYTMFVPTALNIVMANVIQDVVAVPGTAYFKVPLANMDPAIFTQFVQTSLTVLYEIC